MLCYNKGIKYDFAFINIRKVPREALKTEGKARGFQPSRGTLRMLMNNKLMFDRYYCIISTKTLQNEEIIGALYFTAISHFPTRKICMIRAEVKFSSLPRVLCDAW